LISSASNEQDAITFLSDFSSDLSLFSASQRDLQAAIDQRLFDDLFASFGI